MLFEFQPGFHWISRIFLPTRCGSLRASRGVAYSIFGNSKYARVAFSSHFYVASVASPSVALPPPALVSLAVFNYGLRLLQRSDWIRRANGLRYVCLLLDESCIFLTSFHTMVGPFGPSCKLQLTTLSCTSLTLFLKASSIPDSPSPSASPPLKSSYRNSEIRDRVGVGW
jgi:hypothetical protein